MKTRRYIYAILALYLLLVFLGLNPYFIPDYYDNVYYFILGRSLAEQGTYTVMDLYVVDWPLLYPAYLAGVFKFFGSSVFVGNLATGLQGVIALYLIYCVCLKEERTSPLFIALLMALFPTSIGQGTRMSSEWQYIAFSFAFLWSLHRMSEKRGVLWGVGAGILLAAACLTRYIGLALGFAFLYHCWTLLRSSNFRWRSLVPEYICSLVAFILFAVWMMTIFYWKNNPLTPVYQSYYENEGIELWGYFSPVGLGNAILDLWFQFENGVALLGLESWMIWISLIPLSILVYGVGIYLKSKRIYPSDVYVLVVLCVLVFYYWKLSRFILCISPFLLSYFLLGFENLLSKGIRWRMALATAWCLVLLSMDFVLLFVGQGAHGALSPMVSKSEEQFYRGSWKDVVFLSDRMKMLHGTMGFYGTSEHLWIYFYGLSGLKMVEPQEADYVVIENGEATSKMTLDPILKGTNYTLYHQSHPKPLRSP